MHPVGAELCSARCCRFRRKNGRSRAPPLQGPRKKVTSIWISNVPSIDGRYSTATSCKFGTPVSGGAYQDAREVSIEWNARLKHRRSPEFRCRMHQTVTQRPFSPPSFPARRKRRGRRRHPAVANLQQPLSLGFAEPAPLEGEPRNAHRRKCSEVGDDLSGAARQLPWKGSLSFRCGGGHSPSGAVQRSWVSME